MGTVKFHHMDGMAQSLESPSAPAETCTNCIVPVLTCNANACMTIVWLEIRKRPFPIFLLKRERENFDASIRWREMNAVDDTQITQNKRPKDISRTQVEDMHLRFYGDESAPVYNQKVSAMKRRSDMDEGEPHCSRLRLSVVSLHIWTVLHTALVSICAHCALN